MRARAPARCPPPLRRARLAGRRAARGAHLAQRLGRHGQVLIGRRDQRGRAQVRIEAELEVIQQRVLEQQQSRDQRGMALEARGRGDIRVIHLLAQRAPFLGQRIERGQRRGGRGRLAQPRVQLAPLRIDAGRQPASFLARLAAPFRCRLDSPRCACTRRTACSNVATGRAPAASRRFCAAVSHDALTYSSNGTANRIRLNPPSSRNFRCSDNMPSRRFIIFVLPYSLAGLSTMSGVS